MTNIKKFRMNFGGKEICQFMAMSAGECIGSAQLALSTKDDPIAEIRTLYVHVDFRRQKIATKIMSAMISLAQFEGKKAIILDCQKINMSAIRFYTNSHGFGHYPEVTEHFLGPDSDHIVLVRSITSEGYHFLIDQINGERRAFNEALRLESEFAISGFVSNNKINSAEAMVLDKFQKWRLGNNE